MYLILFVVLLSPNIARRGLASQSSNFTYHYNNPDHANYAIDGIFDTDLRLNRCAHTLKEPGAWWQVNLQGVHEIRKVAITTRSSVGK